MSPEAERTFEAEWAVLSRRLRALLGRKGIDHGLHDDLVQETALRLLSMWDGVDRRRPLWPLTVTIALNLLRDRGRHVDRDALVADVPDIETIHDVEAAGLARIELERVRQAMGELSGSQRSALMKEIGAHALATAPDSSGDKMLRMRARRKLKLALENVSAVIALRLRRVAEVVEGLFAVREGAMSAASCVLCLMVGIGAGVVAPAGFTPPASASTERTELDGLAEVSSLAERYAASAPSAWAGAGSASEPRAGDAAADGNGAGSRSTSGRQGRAAEERAGSATGAGDSGSLISALPQDDDQVLPPPDDTAGLSVDNSGPPSVGGDPGDAPSIPSPPTPPAPPPGPPVNAGVPVPPLAEDADTIL